MKLMASIKEKSIICIGSPPCAFFSTVYHVSEYIVFKNKFFLPLNGNLPYNELRYGGLLKRSKRSHSKCDRPLIPARGFESHVLRSNREPAVIAAFPVFPLFLGFFGTIVCWTATEFYCVKTSFFGFHATKMQPRI